MPDFVHLHSHTQFSLLDGAADISTMMDKAKADGMRGVALTDHGNMFGAFKFVAEANKRDLVPIVGCEFYLVEDRHIRSFKGGKRDKRYHQLMLAKNPKGYQNLAKLCSLGFIEGAYGKFPRIDKELVEKYHEGLIATSCCIGAEIPQAIMHGDNEKAEKLTKWWLDLLGEDFYIEIQRHRGLENIDGLGISQEDINQVLLGFAKKYNIKVIATNDSHYVEEEDWNAHDILLCVNTGSKKAEEKRFRFSSSDFFFKTQAEMNALFSDVPESIDNTMEILSKITPPTLKRDILLPNFPMPAGFTLQSDYLRHLVYEGAKIRYGELTAIVTERLDHELNIIKTMGFDGYFLIVQDFIKAARDMGVSVGPGRGSAAGSAVAFALTITNIDPIKYNLLFERFLNPERISMPDIDIDFDDDGRQAVIDWVVDKYGKNQVAQIITFGTMAARSSIRDVARVMDLPLPDADKIAKLIPSKQGKSPKLRKVMGKDFKELKAKWQGDDFANIEALNDLHSGTDLTAETLDIASRIEGNIRNTGIHAAGVIIAPDDITNYIPVCTAKDADLLVTQFDGSVVEDAGMLKMDFLGLRTLTIIKDAIANIVIRYGESSNIDPDDIPLDDASTYKLFQNGDTVGIFQFESEGMQKHLADLKPTNIEDLIAMNALYRPGPMDYIPSFVARKHGKEKVEYPHEWLEDMLKPTYGIMVYQEQIMQCAQIMAGYSLGQADLLRRAMGKKKLSEMEKQKKIFVKGAVEKGVPEEQAAEIFGIMEKFASYGFNRSHAAAYSVVAFQTAYLKAHYPAEYMASVLTHNKSDITKLNFFLSECKRMGLEVLGPDINESYLNFTVNKEGKIRFGLSALKGVGEGPVGEILRGREEGPFTSVFDLCRRLSLRTVNKKSLESLILGGGFDRFTELNRAQYFQPYDLKYSVLEYLILYGNTYQKQMAESSNSLFGGMAEIPAMEEPKIPEIEEWGLMEKLSKEKEVTGFYISGHPLDDYKMEIENFATPIEKLAASKGREAKIGGIVSMASHRVSKRGKQFGSFTLEDYSGNTTITLFGEAYLKFQHFLREGEVLFVKGKFQARWNNEDEFEFKPSYIQQLDTVGQELTESITLVLQLSQLNEKYIDALEEICKDHKGKHKLKMLVEDSVQKVRLPLVSKSTKVNAGSDFIKQLERRGVRYKLN